MDEIFPPQSHLKTFLGESPGTGNSCFFDLNFFMDTLISIEVYLSLFRGVCFVVWRILSTVHPRLSEQVKLKFLLGRSDTLKIRIIEEEHFTY